MALNLIIGGAVLFVAAVLWCAVSLSAAIIADPSNWEAWAAGGVLAALIWKECQL